MESQLLVLVTILLFVSGQLFEGDDCLLDNNKRGVCLKTSDCLGIRQMIAQGRKPKVCSFTLQDSIICCATPRITTKSTTPDAIRPTDTGKAYRKCQEYGRYVVWEVTSPVLMVNPERYNETRCSMPNGLIDRSAVKIEEFPHMAALGYGEENNVKWECAGSLISERFILTTAACLSIAGSGVVRWVRLGDLDLTTSRDMTEPMTIEVSSRTKHPDYVPATLYNNIGLIKLKSDVIFTPSIRPACLYTQPGDPPSLTAVATGWGTLSSGVETEVGNNYLVRANVPLQNAGFCNRTFKVLIKPNGRLRHGVTPTNMICSSGAQSQGQNRICGEDSGGPLQIAMDVPYCMYGITGLTSFSFPPCGWGDGATIYTRVAFYVPWIESIVWP